MSIKKVLKSNPSPKKRGRHRKNPVIEKSEASVQKKAKTTEKKADAPTKKAEKAINPLSFFKVKSSNCHSPSNVL